MKTDSTIKEEQKSAIQSKFDVQEKHFTDVERTIAALRKFFLKHRETIAPFNWQNYGYSTEITFNCYNQDPKKIAAAFGNVGWTRKMDRYSCGSINWFKTVDGIELQIESAEKLSPKLNEEVKFPNQ